MTDRRPESVGHPARRRWRAGFIATIVLAIGAPITWVWLQSTPSDAHLRSLEGKLIGHVIGYMAGLDQAGQQLRVSLNRFGLRPFVFQLTDDTQIVVHGKLGGLGDLEHVMSVQVRYELRNGTRVATTIQIGDAEAPRIEAVPPAVVTPPSRPVRPYVVPRPVTTTPEIRPAKAPTPPLTPAPPRAAPEPARPEPATIEREAPPGPPPPAAPSTTDAEGAGLPSAPSTPEAVVQVAPPVHVAPGPDVTPADPPPPRRAPPQKRSGPAPASTEKSESP